MHGMVREIVAERFAREAVATIRFDISYREHRGVGSDSYIDVRGNRYGVSDKRRVPKCAFGLDGVRSCQAADGAASAQAF